MNLLTEEEYTSCEEILRDSEGRKPAETLGRDRFLAWMATKGVKNLYFFNRAILGFAQMVPHLHGELCEFAQRKAPKRKGYLISRGHYKSSSITIGKNCHTLICDCNARIGIFHEKATQAEQFLSQIKHHFSQNPLLKALYPQRIPRYTKKGWRWKTDSFDIPRDRQYPEPSIYAAGQGSALQGFHFTHMTWDDLIGEEASGNAEVMQKVIDWMTRAEALSVTPETLELDLIGTRWAYYDIYSWAQDEGYPDMEWFERSAIVKDEEGHDVPVFPEQFSIEALLAIKARDFVSFSCQYMNQPATGEKMEFDPSWLRYYRRTEKRIDDSEQGYLQQLEERDEDTSPGVPLKHLTVFIHCDPGLGIVEGPKKAVSRHSHSAITVVGTAYPKRIYILETWKKREGIDEFIEQILRYFKAYERQLQWVTIEKHSWTRIVKAPLLQKAKDRGLELSEGRIRDYTGSANEKKDGRIRSLQPYFRHGQVFLDPAMVDLEKEYRDFPLGKGKDLLDALSQGPSGNYWVFTDEEEDDPWNDSAFRPDYDPEQKALEEGRSAVTGY